MQSEAVFNKISERIHSEICKAQKTIYIAVAWFTNKMLFNELVNRSINGCTVMLIISNDDINLNSAIDYSTLQTDKSKVFKIGNADTVLMHNKFCVIDYSTVITGSYNWSYKAERNFENVIITQNDTTLAGQFISEFNRIRKQYYPDVSEEENIFPLGQIVKRLEILRNHIVHEQIEEINYEIMQLSAYDFNADLRSILYDVKQKSFTSAINRIQLFISRNQQLLIWTNPIVAALKLEIRTLENQLNSFDNEKLEIEKLLSEFHHRHTIELGYIILSILKLRKLKFKDDNTKYEDAENDENQYRNQIDNERIKTILELSEEQKIEIKRKFRKATVLCHPDKVSDELHESAQRVFIDLKQAYDVNDLKKVTEILDELEKGNFFKARSETVLEEDLLRNAIAKLRRQINILETEVRRIKNSESFIAIISIEDWDEYFSRTKEKLENELKMLRLELEF